MLILHNLQYPLSEQSSRIRQAVGKQVEKADYYCKAARVV